MKKRGIMKIRILSCFFVLISFCASGQDLSGTYYSEFGTKIEIRGNELTYIEPHFSTPVRSNDTLAKCTFEWVDADFIKINSTPPDIIALKGLNITQHSDSTVIDSIKVSFSIPYQRCNLKIQIHTDTFKTFDFVYSQGSRDVMLPNNVRSITFYIAPEHIIPHTTDGLFYGVIGFDPFQEFEIKENTNTVLIEIPALDDSFFERYYIKDEFARVSNDSIMWKGEVFVKGADAPIQELFQLEGEAGNQLNEMITSSINSYITWKNSFVKDGITLHDTCHYWVCKDGFPADFPYDSMQNVTFLSLHNLNGLSKSLRKELKKGIDACFVWLKLTERQLVIGIGGRRVKLIKKSDFEISMGDWSVFTYEYSCEKQKWLLTNTEYGGI
ncbi:MAG TPA: hypothetical protein PK979_00065 [Bacteroidales bacterium]|nr:hypothetical protein [Bacteroidales bacterium]